MRKLLNVLYVTTKNAYATLDGENVAIKEKEKVIGRFPLHILEGIYLFSYAGASPALIKKCTDYHIDLTLCSPTGQYLGRPIGRTQGNVLLRREQYRIADSAKRSSSIGKNFIIGKVLNEKHVLDRMRRDHPDRINPDNFKEASLKLKNIGNEIMQESQVDSLRGLEGAAANVYFGLFNRMVLRNEEDFIFHGRNRRPPLDNVNALLSYVYMMLTGMCASALETVGLDPYVGFIHTDRPGRMSLALDLLEEFRSCFADRFVLSIINNGVVNKTHFSQQENGAILISDEGRKQIHQTWQKRKQEKIEHPYLKEKVEWGLIPYVQAMLLARCIRGDIDGYPPFIWR